MALAPMATATSTAVQYIAGERCRRVDEVTWWEWSARGVTRPLLCSFTAATLTGRRLLVWHRPAASPGAA